MSEGPVEMTQAVVLRLSEHFVAGGAKATSAGLGQAIHEVALALHMVGRLIAPFGLGTLFNVIMPTTNNMCHAPTCPRIASLHFSASRDC
jgi:hypothetical protein